MDKQARIFVTGHRGMVGSAIVRRLRAGGYDNLLLRTHAELDLLDQRAVHDFLAEQQLEVGGRLPMRLLPERMRLF